MTWSLPKLLEQFHKDVADSLFKSRKLLGHPVDKGNQSEGAWLAMMKAYLPQRYTADRAFVVDSEGSFSDQIDIVVYDRHYSPFVFLMNDTKIIPAESVYAVFESKQSLSAADLRYARKKIKSVRRLSRTSLPVPHVGGLAKPKNLHHILGGFLALESNWSPALGAKLRKELSGKSPEERIDIGCIASHGYFKCDDSHSYNTVDTPKAVTAFLFDLLYELQKMATVPMIDIRAYGKWLDIK
jgi:hypothetical protein